MATDAHAQAEPDRTEDSKTSSGRGTAVGTPYPPTSRRYARCIIGRWTESTYGMYPDCSSMYTGTRADRKKALEASDISSLVGRRKGACKEGRSQTHSREQGFSSLLMFMLRGHTLRGPWRTCTKGTCRGMCCLTEWKTGRALTVSLTPEAMQMVRMVANRSRLSYLFPILQSEEGTEAAYREYQSALRGFNQRLAVLRQCLGMQSALSTYAARHLGHNGLPLRDTPGIISKPWALLHHGDGNLSEAFQQQKD